MRDSIAHVLRRASTLVRVVAYVSAALCVAPFVYHLARGSTAYLGLLEDDYYYYALVADRFVTLGRLTFDGTTATNGFHPLWFALIVLFRAVFGRFGLLFYLALATTFWISMVVTFELGRRFARSLGASATLASAISVVYFIGTAQLLANGMESVVAIPLFLWLLAEVAETDLALTSRRAAKIGFISSLAVLARLDLAMAVLILVVGYVVAMRHQRASAYSRLVVFALAAGLVPVYLIANAFYFGHPLPVSALAKRLIVVPGFDLSYARRVALGSVYGRSVGVVLPIGVIALVLLVVRSPWRNIVQRFAGGLALLFAFAFFALNALAGWILFGWYAYPLAIALIASLVFICEQWGPLFPARIKAAIATILVAMVPISATRYYFEHGPWWSIRDNSLLATSYDIADHLRRHDGLLAMGAVAGMATYVLDKPVLQIEGILADQRMLEHVRNQDPLGEVLREYRADYLIVSLANARSERRNGCYVITQPHAEWAGARTAKMRDEICTEPIEHFFTTQGQNPWSQFPSIETLVWDLRKARWKSDTAAPSIAVKDARHRSVAIVAFANNSEDRER